MTSSDALKNAFARVTGQPALNRRRPTGTIRVQKLGGERLTLQSLELAGLLDSVADNFCEFSMRQRVAIATDNRLLTCEDAMSIPDKEITVAFMKTHGVLSTHLITSDVSIQNLKARGGTIEDLLQLGFDSIDLANSASLSHQFVLSYGEHAVHQAFMRSARDAVIIAGTPAQAILGITTTDLMAACVGLVDEGVCVLRLLGPGALLGVHASVLREGGIGGVQLAAAGHSALDTARDLYGDPDEVSLAVGLSL